jgi:hypothetical protein
MEMTAFIQNQTTQAHHKATEAGQQATREETARAHRQAEADRAAARQQAERHFNTNLNRDKEKDRAPKPADIVDPQNPDQMIKVDLNKWNPTTREGVIGVAGKEPAAALRINKQEEGKRDARSVIDSLRTAYQNLDKMRAIPSTERNAASNLVSGIAATGIGQTAGRLVGTDAQTERDVIKSSRMQLLNAIKSATGMSAQQMNSNIELKTWLDAVSDPGQSYQATNRILDNIESFIASGGKAKESDAAPNKPPSRPPLNSFNR